MTTLRLEQTVPIYSLALRDTDGSQLFRLVRGEGTPAYWSDMLLPHH